MKSPRPEARLPVRVPCRGAGRGAWLAALRALMLQMSRRQSRLSGNPHLTAMFVQGRTGSGRERQSRPQTWSHLRAPVYFCRCLYPQESWGGAFQTRPCSLHPLWRITGHIPVRQGCHPGQFLTVLPLPVSKVSLLGWSIARSPPPSGGPPLHPAAGPLPPCSSICCINKGRHEGL